ncbi:putative protein-serine/threonine phosphatase [Helianthus annuus]|nr:putative protein-serine/threonine phosphatase [Helianthus annuus]
MANEPPLSIYQQKLDLMGSTNHHHFPQRLATFLNPVAKTLHEPAPISKQPNPHFNFKQWRHPPAKWAKWVDQMARKHSTVWKQSGIFNPIMSSIYKTPCNPNIISTLSHFWTPQTNTFVFPWGEATLTLEDVMILGGFSVVGDSVNDGSVALTPDLAGKVEKMNRFRSELVRSKSKKASHSKWMQMFMTSTNEQEHEEEHVGFLALWLSRFVFPSGDQDSVGKHVIPIAVRLSQGVKLALAPAVLAYIYHNLTKLKEQCVDSSYSNLKSSSCVNLLGPFQLVQIWVYERFPVVGPKRPNELRPGEPRLARWHGLNSNAGLPLFHSHMISLESFIWRPYAVDLQNWKQPLYYQDSEQIISDSLVLDDDLQSFIRFIAPCELNGLGCKAEYHPHRVAMQFGFDQDIPGDDLSGYEFCKFGKFFVPSRSFQPGVSKRYYDWWKNVDRKCVENEQDSWLGERVNASVECGNFEQENCDKKCDSEFVEDEFDDILVSLKKICNATKRKIDALKESCVGAPQSKKEKLGSGLGNEASGVIIVD